MEELSGHCSTHLDDEEHIDLIFFSVIGCSVVTAAGFSFSVLQIQTKITKIVLKFYTVPTCRPLKMDIQLIC